MKNGIYPLYPEKLQVSLDTFIQRMYLLNGADNPQLVTKLIIKWTQGQSLLTKKLLQYVLQSENRINEGEEAIAVETVIRNCLLKEFKQDDLTLTIREKLYAKDLNNLIEINNGEIRKQDLLDLVELQKTIGLTEKQAKQVHHRLGVNNYFSFGNNDYLGNGINNLVVPEENNIDKYSGLVKIPLETPRIKKHNNDSSIKKWLLIIFSIPLLFLMFRSINWYRQYQTKSAYNFQSELKL